MKRELLPSNFDVIKPLEDDCIFSGINGTKLELLGIFEAEFMVNGCRVDLRFYVVPGNTMVVNAILGRDFITKPSVSLCFENGAIKLNVADDRGQMNGTTDNLHQVLCVNQWRSNGGGG